MPKNTKKRTKVKDLPRPKQELTAKAAKKVKGGVENPTTAESSALKQSPTLRIGVVKKTWDM